MWRTSYLRKQKEWGSPFIWPAGELIFRILESRIPRQPTEAPVTLGHMDISLACPSSLACVPTHWPYPLSIGHPATAEEATAQLMWLSLSTKPWWGLCRHRVVDLHGYFTFIPFRLVSNRISTMRVLWATHTPSWDTYIPDVLWWFADLSVSFSDRSTCP